MCSILQTLFIDCFSRDNRATVFLEGLYEPSQAFAVRPVVPGGLAWGAAPAHLNWHPRYQLNAVNILWDICHCVPWVVGLSDWVVGCDHIITAHAMLGSAVASLFPLHLPETGAQSSFADVFMAVLPSQQPWQPHCVAPHPPTVISVAVAVGSVSVVPAHEYARVPESGA